RYCWRDEIHQHLLSSTKTRIDKWNPETRFTAGVRDLPTKPGGRGIEHQHHDGKYHIDRLEHNLSPGLIVARTAEHTFAPAFRFKRQFSDHAEDRNDPQDEQRTQEINAAIYALLDL